jgi:hypothetical protein
MLGKAFDRNLGARDLWNFIKYIELQKEALRGGSLLNP